MLKKLGWRIFVCEQSIHINPGHDLFRKTAFFRRDAFGFGDILAFHPIFKVTMLVQATAGMSNFSARLHKIEKIPVALEWLAMGNRIEIHCWNKRAKSRGGRKAWECRREYLATGLAGALVSNPVETPV